MSTAAASSESGTDDCSICLNALGLGASLLTLSCGHKFHLQCLASNVKAQNKECPLCRAVIDTSLISMLTGNNQLPLQQSVHIVVPSVEDTIDEVSVRELSSRITTARQAAASSYSTSDIPFITANHTQIK